MSFNKAIVLGRIGKDPTVKYTTDGTAISSFSVATSEFRKSKDGQKNEDTQWHNVVCFGKTAEYVNLYLKKGSKICVDGSLKTSSWDDKDGKKCYKTEIVASKVIGLDGKGDSAGVTKSPKKDYKVEVNSDFGAEDIPF